MATHQGDELERVIRALEDPRYSWRTVEGIAASTGLAPEVIERVFSVIEDRLIRSSSLDERGRALYTTRSHYKTHRRLLDRVRDAIVGRVA